MGAVRPHFWQEKSWQESFDEVSRRLLFAFRCGDYGGVQSGYIGQDKAGDLQAGGREPSEHRLQSADNRELKTLGRIHTWEQFLHNYELVRELGFANVNIDLMSALPGQTREGWLSTLEKVTNLNPEHISAYSLIVEEGTPFYERYGEDRPQESELPGEDLDRLMYEDTKAFLHGKGYERYEISNYAKPGYECRHNCSYWERTDYRGFGTGAASLLGEVRYKNSTDLKEYLKGHFTYESVEPLNHRDALEETMFLGLREMRGVAVTEEIQEVYGPVAGKADTGRGSRAGRRESPADDRGIDVSNMVLAEFLLD